MKKADTIINFVLDESGSMEGIRDSVISGFNEYVNGLKKQKTKSYLTLTKFDSNGIRIPYSMVDVKEVRKLTKKGYQPNAMTPLYDAVVETVEKMAKKVKSNQKAIVVIMTDGEENSSRKHDERCLRSLIEKLQKKDNWTFVYMGANQDSWGVASNLGFHRGNVMDWEATRGGTKQVFASTMRSAETYAASADLSTKSYFQGGKNDS